MSMEDIIALMKAQKAEQKLELEEMFTKQRVEEKKERDKDKDVLVKEIRAGIKEDIKEEMKPLEERTANMEKVTISMGDQVEELVKKVATLEEQLETVKEKQQYVKSYSEVTKEQNSAILPRLVQKQTNRQEIRKEENNNKEGVEKLFSNAAKVIGFKPIDKVHVEHIMRRQKEEMKDKSEDDQWQEALSSAVKMFLDKEMRMKEDEYERLEIVKIFPPAKADWNVLYVEFKTKQQADLVYTYTQYMRRNVQGEGKPEVQMYVPKALFSRFRAINQMAFKIRQDSGKTMSTRVTLGRDDFILQQRSKAERGMGWGDSLPLPEDLPEIELSLQRGPLSPGEAPGRTPLTPEQDDSRKRKERSSPISPGSSKSPASKQITLHEKIAAAKLVSDCSVTTPPPGMGLLAAPECGSVTSVQGQSTPSRLKKTGEKEISSPIISSRRLAQKI